MRSVFYACDRNNLSIPSTSDIITPSFLPLLHAASSQLGTESTHRAHHTVHRQTATQKYPGSDPQIDTPVLCPSGARGFSPRPVLFLSTVYHHHHYIEYTI
jgi:hypothetical protein